MLFVLEDGALGVFKDKDNMVEDETPGVMFLCKRESSVIAIVTKSKVFFQPSLNHFFDATDMMPNEKLAAQYDPVRVMIPHLAETSVVWLRWWRSSTFQWRQYW